MLTFTPACPSQCWPVHRLVHVSANLYTSLSISVLTCTPICPSQCWPVHRLVHLSADLYTGLSTSLLSCSLACQHHNTDLLTGLSTLPLTCTPACPHHCGTTAPVGPGPPSVGTADCRAALQSRGPRPWPQIEGLCGTSNQDINHEYNYSKSKHIYEAVVEANCCNNKGNGVHIK